MGKSSYHHGDLRNALLHAAEQTLRETGIEKLSLRAVARAAEVSHAAPAHHFGDLQGLLTALATVGFDRFLAAQQRRQDAADDDPVERRAAAGLAYIEFSERNPELFHLMFVSQQIDREDPDLQLAAGNAFSNLVMLVNDVKGGKSEDDMTHIMDVYAAWAMVHGLSSLLSSGQMSSITGSRKNREAQLKSILINNLANS